MFDPFGTSAAAYSHGKVDLVEKPKPRWRVVGVYQELERKYLYKIEEYQSYWGFWHRWVHVSMTNVHGTRYTWWNTAGDAKIVIDHYEKYKAANFPNTIEEIY